MAKARPFSSKTRRQSSLITPFTKNKKFSISARRRVAFQRRKLRLITRARLAATKFIYKTFRTKRKR
jgi:hypothetical protein